MYGSIVRPYGSTANSNVQSSTVRCADRKVMGAATIAPIAYVVHVMIVGSIHGLIADQIEFRSDY